MSDLEMIQDPDRWRRFPLLPLVRGPESAFVVCRTLEGKLDGEVEVWRGNIFAARDALSDPENKRVYKNAQAVLDDGWRVD